MLPIRLGPPELIVILIIILLLFGVGRISKIAGEMGRGIREFRKAVGESKEKGEEEKTIEKSEEKPQA
jgi:sec-independent protein translocase protein TatA